MPPRSCAPRTCAALRPITRWCWSTASAGIAPPSSTGSAMASPTARRDRTFLRFPSSALKQVEVLRDGASAQYGSDAIAGVMNFILNDANHGANVEARYGGYYAGDGATYAISGNIGLPLTSNGFVNFSFEYGETRSDRPQHPAQRRSGADRRRQHRRQESGAGLGLAGDPGRSEDVHQLGRRPQRDTRALWPRQLRLQDCDRRLLLPQSQYARGRVQRRQRRDTADRRPDAGHRRRARRSRSPTMFPIRRRCAAVFADPNCFSFQEMFPGGFTPQFGGDLKDYAAVAGLARHGRRAHQLGCERGLRLQPRGLLHHQHGERVARARNADDVRPGLVHSGRAQRQLRRRRTS